MERGKSVQILPETPATSAPPPTPVRRRPKAAKLPASLEAQVGRFSAPARRELRRLIRSSPRFADLVETFPGMAYALATGRSRKALRDEALAMVVAGAPLKAVARKLALPVWLKKLPPEAFERPLGDLPSSEVFARRVASRLPHDVRQASFWLDAIGFAAKAGHDELAIWLAEQPIFADRGDPQRLLCVLCAYAWYSRAPATGAGDLIVVPWRPEIAFDTAVCSAKSWLNRMRLIMQLEAGVLNDPWLIEGTAQGYTFVPLLDRESLIFEAHAMQNCADQYAERLARDRCRLFSVRRAGTHVATLEIGPHARETGVLAITQLKARHNMPASIDVWQAAHAWMAQQSGLKRLPPMVAPERAFNDKMWRSLMEPYRASKGGAPWFPARLSPVSFARMDMDMGDLARRGRVSSWLFT